MAEATRYYLIPQSTFETWFAISPAGDACSIQDYQIYSTVSPLAQVLDSQISLIGSMGTYKLRLDKTVATNTKTFYLRSVTRGLVSVD